MKKWKLYKNWNAFTKGEWPMQIHEWSKFINNDNQTMTHINSNYY